MTLTEEQWIDQEVSSLIRSGAVVPHADRLVKALLRLAQTREKHRILTPIQDTVLRVSREQS